MIRRAQASDALIIAQLYQDTIRAVNIKDYNLEQATAWAARGQDIDRWLGKIADQHFIVSIEQDQIVGFASLTSEGHIDLMFVHKDQQGKGIAKGLLIALEQHAVNTGLGEFKTEASITAKPFFERQGFQVNQQQTVMIGEIAFTNFKMRKLLSI